MIESGDLGSTYTFQLDPAGATSDYTPFAMQCAAAHPAVVAATARLQKAKAKLAKAKAKRSHNRKRKHKKVKRLRKRVKARKAELTAAEKAERNACSVPE